MNTDNTPPIQAHDLSVGSYVMDEDAIRWSIEAVHDTWCDVKGLKHKSFISLYYADMRPIPISPEWLDRLGFTKTPYGRFIHPDTAIYVWPSCRPWESDYLITIEDHTLPFASIHHLQALVWHHCRVWLRVSE